MSGNGSSQRKVLRLDVRDNVLVALTDLPKGQSVGLNGESYQPLSDIPAKQKFLTRDVPSGGDVIMYGVLVGKATEDLRRGDLLSTRNIRHATEAYHAQDTTETWTSPDTTRWRERTFLGYHRANGQVGTRNHWIVLPLVFCENRNLNVLKQAFEEELGFAAPQIYRQQVAELVRAYRHGTSQTATASAVAAAPPGAPKVFENIDGIKFLIHEGGCGATREDAKNLCLLLADYIQHPNVAGATVLSLGCQHSQISMLQDAIQQRDPHFDKPLFIYEQQKSASEQAMLAKAIAETFAGLVEANKLTRKPAHLSHLSIGLKCGGSDGFSGLSANPAIGHLSDIVAAVGGKTILSEFPELCGVEQELINRCVSKDVSDRFIKLMGDYSARAKAVFASFEMNPSPGNIRDGLLTDAMKSAGAAKKGGTSPVTGVLDYPEYATKPGLNLLCTPGSDVECVTAQVGAGANIVLFTTGLGTPTGNPITPVIKISTNTSLANRMSDIIDFNAGEIISGQTTIEKVGEAILDRVIQTASGEAKTKAELLAQDDFIPWKRGVSL
jgi:altronate hydrolase